MNCMLLALIAKAGGPRTLGRHDIDVVWQLLHPFIRQLTESGLAEFSSGHRRNTARVDNFMLYPKPTIRVAISSLKSQQHFLKLKNV